MDSPNSMLLQLVGFYSVVLLGIIIIEGNFQLKVVLQMIFLRKSNYD